MDNTTTKPKRRYRKLLWGLVVLLCSMIVVSCSDSAISPTSNTDNNLNKPHIATNLKPVAITIRAIGTDTMSASIKPINLINTPKVAANITVPSDNSNTHSAKGTIQYKKLSQGSFTIGNRSSNIEDNGYRYIFVTLAVRNADNSGQPYTKDLNNLVFLAVSTPQKLDSNPNTDLTTIGHTSIAKVQRYGGYSFSIPKEDIAQNIIPTGKVTLNRVHQMVPNAVDVFQVYSEAQVGGITTNHKSIIPFPYGFTVINRYNGSRVLRANPDEHRYAGIVTFAFKVPLHANIRKDPYFIQFIFAPVQQDKMRVTQAPEEQGHKGYKMLADHIKNDLGGINNVDKIVVFPGSRFWQFPNKTKIKCSDVRVAGKPGNPIITTLLTDAQKKQVGAYPLNGDIGDQVTIHGCDFDINAASVSIGGVSAPVITSSSGSKKLVVDIPDGVALTQDNPVKVTRSNSKTYSAGDIHVSGSIIGGDATVTTNCTGITSIIGIGLTGCAVDNKGRLVDSNPNNYAKLHAGAISGSKYVDVTYSGPAIPAGGQAGFVIKNNGGLLNASLLGGITITTYLGNQLQETATTTGGVLSAKLLSGGQKQFVGFKTTKPFDEIKFTVSSTSVDLSAGINFYGAYGDR